MYDELRFLIIAIALGVLCHCVHKTNNYIKKLVNILNELKAESVKEIRIEEYKNN